MGKAFVILSLARLLNTDSPPKFRSKLHTWARSYRSGVHDDSE
jgi:hypothetical protein